MSYSNREPAPFALAVFVPFALGLTATSTDARADDSQTESANEIVIENQLPGNPPSEWDIDGAGDDSIQGFADEISVDGGQEIRFKIKTDSSDYRIDIYRLGYYGGLGARKVTSILPSASLPQSQPACVTDPTVGLVDCGNWVTSATWSVPATAVSGIYFAKLVRQDPPHAGETSHIHFVVRDDDGQSDLLFQTSDTTWQAYNSYGGASLYIDTVFDSHPHNRAFKVSYNRPFVTRANVAGFGKRGFLFNAEYPLVRWLERNGYDVSYSTGVDTDRRGAELLDHKVFLSVGQDEYWSAGQRANVKAARDAGVDLAFFSGNTSFWKTRWEPSIAGPTTPWRTLVCYKETHVNAKIDPLPNVWTGTWRDPRFSPPADGGQPENALQGSLFNVNGPRFDSMSVPYAEGKLRLWRNTPVAAQSPGGAIDLPAGTLGHEWDEDIDNGSRPAGLFHLSSATIDVSQQFLLNYGSKYGDGRPTHSLNMYRHASGALVFSTASIQWSWGLDSEHDHGPSVTDDNMRQATVNLLADMGAQPESLDPDLLVAAASTDLAAPTSFVLSPTPQDIVPSCDLVTISGSATDTGGGRVAGVEVTVNGGTTWHRAQGRETWSYTWKQGVPGPAVLRSRAVDDSGNLESPGPGVLITRTHSPDCPRTIFRFIAKPDEDSHGDRKCEVGVKFHSDVAGTVTGLRFYRGSGNNGTHVGHLWSSTGTLLASQTFTDETATGWQQVALTTPVAIAADTTYVVSYYSQAGHALDERYFSGGGTNNGVLHAPESGPEGGNGVIHIGPTSAFPDQTIFDSNYWVDIVFEPNP